jgi:ABC-type antimicrobial peptide transport system permease subunit
MSTHLWLYSIAAFLWWRGTSGVFANITIAAVIERTPEFGLRRAIGTTQGDIMLQFILEATLLSPVGGVAAMITVYG